MESNRKQGGKSRYSKKSGFESGSNYSGRKMVPEVGTTPKGEAVSPGKSTTVDIQGKEGKDTENSQETEERKTQNHFPMRSD